MASPAPASRVQSIDALRGFVMIIMALDHTREFFHAGAFLFQPEDLTDYEIGWKPTFADGHVIFVKNTIAPAIWQAIATRAGGEVAKFEQ